MLAPSSPSRRDASLAATSVLLALVASACAPSVGERCTPDDLERATAVVYDAEGMPAYEGQAMLVSSCGGSSFCHTQRATGPDVRRFGAPADLVFDPLLVDGEGDEAAALARLARAVTTTQRHRDAIFAAVHEGSMPPAGRPPVPDLRGAAEAYRTYESDADVEGTPLPAVQSAEGREILRNWLACGSPVVERTQPGPPPTACAADADCTITHICDPSSRTCAPVGSVVPRRGVSLEPTWSSIHSAIIRPTCAIAGCHVGATAFHMLDLSDREAAYTALTTRTASAGCGMAPYVTPGAPDASLLLDKLGESPSCGERMPLTGALSDETVEVIRAWVVSGARDD